MKTTLALLLILFSSVETTWLTNFDEAVNTAKTENKNVLLNFSGSDWCAPCIKMKKEVFESEAFQALASESLVLVRADFPRNKKHQLSKEQTQHNEALAEKYNPKGKFPLTLLIDANGKVIKEWDGYVFASQDKFMDDLKGTLTAR